MSGRASASRRAQAARSHQVVVARAGHEDRRAGGLQPLDHEPAQEAGAAGDDDAPALPEGLHRMRGDYTGSGYLSTFAGARSGRRPAVTSAASAVSSASDAVLSPSTLTPPGFTVAP